METDKIKCISFEKFFKTHTLYGNSFLTTLFMTRQVPIFLLPLGTVTILHPVCETLTTKNFTLIFPYFSYSHIGKFYLQFLDLLGN